MPRIEDRYISLLTDFGFFTPRELREYEDSRKAYRDLKNSLDTALREGIAQPFTNNNLVLNYPFTGLPYRDRHTSASSFLRLST